MRHILIGAAAVLVSAAPGFAQDAGPAAQTTCLFTAPATSAAGETIARLEGAEGSVVAAGSEGYTSSASEIELRVGDRVVLLEDGKAILVAGDAVRHPLAGPAVVDVSLRDGSACVSIEASTRTFAQQQQTGMFAGTGGPGAVVTGLGILGLGTTAVVAADEINDDDERRDRPTSP